MKIALIGEMSGLYKNLRIGLENCGHQVDLYADGDGWKDIEGATFPLSMKRKNTILSKIYGYLIWPIWVTHKINNYDVVQLVSPHLFMDCINSFLIKRIIKNNKKVFLSMAGNCFLLESTYLAGKYRYSTYDDAPDAFIKKNLFWNKNKEKYLIEKFKGIIPISYEYLLACNECENLKKPVQIPIDYGRIKYKENRIHDKIVIFHGLNRENEKGTKYIRKAMENIEKKYPDRVKCIIKGKMSLTQYLKAIEQTNILIDQCKSYGWGLNALYGLALGKVVLGGSEKEAKDIFNVPDNPIINILPDEKDIFNKLESLIFNTDYIFELGEKGRKYIESYHNPTEIAKQYIEIWENEKE